MTHIHLIKYNVACCCVVRLYKILCTVEFNKIVKNATWWLERKYLCKSGVIKKYASYAVTLSKIKKKYNNLSNITDFKVPKTLTFIAFKDCEVVSSKTLLVLFLFSFKPLYIHG